jgi:uncharacterized protein (TIGR00251 family)
MTIPGFLRAQADGTLLSVKVQPRASKNEICAPLGNELKIKVAAPPVDAAANEALVQLLADELGPSGIDSRPQITAQGCETSRLRAGRSAQKTFGGRGFVNALKFKPTSTNVKLPASRQ